ncbi:protein of unknown function [Methylobacterium sp. ap11]|uniref:DUF4139 domain-containing protein n=1 Tax=Methylobacterium sp. ap11 TaxID=1761799 RepID=UPI0008B6FAC8|nr:DUF4139 domain-containing protein [Methylobacterium sp. ap11]SEP46269.1 protein of unknown function [Methylobacterium sp. ap11]
MTHQLLLAGTLLLMIAAAPPLMAASGLVREVTLSSGGLAEVTLAGSVDGDATIALDVRADQIDDILKSLVVRDPGGRVGAMRLDGEDQVEEVLRGVPFTADDLSSSAQLAGKLQGVEVRVESGGRVLEGRVLGLSEREAGAETGTVRVLSLLTGSGALESVRVDDGLTVTIRDPAMAARIAEVVDVAGRAKASGARRVEIALSGTGAREVRLTYVVAAPVWKTSYRIVDHGDGRANLQAWAIIENALGEDWKGVDVTLSSGAPVTLQPRLHRRTWRRRADAPVPVEDLGLPDLDAGTLAARPAAPPMPAPMERMRRSADARYEAAPAAVAAQPTEGDVVATFRLPHPVDLGVGRTLSVPILDTEIEAARIALWKPGQGLHPVAALMLRNGTGTTLPPGILTVYDRALGYVGDARLPVTPAGEQRFAAFAADRKVAVRAEAKPADVLTRIAVVDGALRATARTREETVYTVKGAPDAARTVVIEHPRRDGWTFSSPARDGETAAAYRLTLDVAAAGTAEARAVLERVQTDTYALAEAEAGMLVSWSALADDPALANGLKALSRARADSQAATREIAEIGERIATIATEQERIRGNLGVVPKDSELARRYLAQMGTQEDALARLGTTQDEARARLGTQEARVRALIAELSGREPRP